MCISQRLKMWLFLVGLAILTGDVLSQVNKVIDSETDLLALPSDQLIHSSAELLALEDLNTGLSFGPRLSGYENPLFAYSYTIKESPSDHGVKTLSNIPEHSGIQSTRNVLPLPNFSFRDSSTTFQKGIHRNIMTTDHEGESTIEEVSFTDKPLTFSVQYDVPGQNNRKLDTSGNTPPKKTGLFFSHLPLLEKDSQSSSGTRIPQKQHFTVDYLPPNVDSSSNLSLEYLPPQETHSKVPDLNQQYLPPREESSLPTSLNLDYLPPDKEIDSFSNLDLDYLPPKEKLAPSTTLNLDYLPPSKDESKTSVVDQEYLPPNEEQTKVVSLIQEYLSPDEKQTSLNQEYLPPQKKDSLNQEYLPPNKLPSDGIDTINKDYLPPIEEFVSSTRLVSESLPFSQEPIALKTESSLLLVPLAIEQKLVPPTIEYTPYTSKFASSIEKTPTFSKVLPPIKQLQELKHQSTFGLIRNKPQVDSIHTDIVNEPIVAVSKGSNEVHVSTIFSLNNEKISKKKSPILKPFIDEIAVRSPPAGARREVNLIKSISPTEVKNEPISLRVEQNRLAPYSVVYEHQDVPIRPVGKETKYTPLVTIAANTDAEIKPQRDNNLIKPISVPIKFTNVPIVPKGEDTRLILTPFIEESIKSPIKPIAVVEEVAEGGLSLKPVRDKSQSFKVPIIESSQSRESYARPQRYSRPTAVFGSQITHNDPIIPQSYYASIPLSLFYEESPQIHPIRDSSTHTAYPVSVEKSSGCLSNSECDEKEVCQHEKCIPGCSLAKHICIGDARCQTRYHVPACICPLSYMARTVKSDSGSIQFDCTPSLRLMSASTSNIIKGSGERTPSRYNRFSYQRPIAGFPIAADDFDDYQRPSYSPSRLRDSSKPCSPSPCGPNTDCSVNNRGIALCRCTGNYIPDGNTINGCKPQCTHSDDCTDNYKCSSNKCVRVCDEDACGLHAECRGNNHIPVCSCPTGYGGDPHQTCKFVVPVTRAPPNLPVLPCDPNPCGTDADCRAKGERAVCSCPRGYEGNPLEYCRKGECIAHDDCSNHLACQNLKCIDPCRGGICGHSADCAVRNHQPVCSCPSNYIGDPLESCRRVTEHDICNPTPCGDNTNCRAKTDRPTGSLRAVCSCIENYIGNPLSSCRAECISDRDCSSSQHCKKNRCRNPCIDGCGEGAYCDARNHRAICTCPEYFQGDAHNRCYPECIDHDRCPQYQACMQFKCDNPCVGACGTGADCVVENHTPICSCPRGSTGDPFTSCRLFTPEDLCRDNPCGSNANCQPGKDRSGNDRPVCLCPDGYVGNPLISCQLGECKDHDDCSNHQACYAYMCQSPCYTSVGSVCGENARCEVKNHQPVCSCPTGYSGNPLQQCRISASTRIAGRSYRKV